MHAMASTCSSLFKTGILVVKYPEGVPSEVNRFYLIFFHRSGKWNKTLKVARRKFMPVLASLSGKCNLGACRVLRELG